MPLFVIVGTRRSGKSTVLAIANAVLDIPSAHEHQTSIYQADAAAFTRLLAQATYCTTHQQDLITELHHMVDLSQSARQSMYQQLRAAGAIIGYVECQERRLAGSEPDPEAASWYQEEMETILPHYQLHNNTTKIALVAEVARMALSRDRPLPVVDGPLPAANVPEPDNGFDH